MLARLMLASLCFAPVVGLAAAVSPSVADDAPVTVRDADQMLDLLKRAMWRTAEAPATEVDGRTIQDDLSELTLTDSTLEEIAKLRARMVEAHGEDGEVSPMLLTSYIGVLGRESCRSKAIIQYWAPGGPEAGYHESLIRAMHQRLKSGHAVEAEFEELRQRVRISRETMLQLVADCASNPDAASTQALATRADYARIRARYAAQIDAAMAEGRLPPRIVEREAPCPAPAQPRQGDNKARIRNMPDIGNFYPILDRAMMIEGVVRVMVEWDDTGCVLRTRLVNTSGSESLDDAALRAIQLMSMEPMTVGGVPQGDAATLPVRFSLNAGQ
jgi:TonB family protein